MHHELRTKSIHLVYLLFIAFSLWMTGVVTLAYAFYFNWPSIATVGLILNSFSLVFSITVLSMWMYKIASIQNVKVARVDMLAIEEYTCLAYLLPTILFAISIPLWNWCNSDWNWQNRKESSLIFFMVVHFIFSVAITSTIL